MHRVVELTSADIPQWDAFVAKHPAGWMCHLSGWRVVLEKCFPHIKGHIIAARDETTGALAGGLPLYSVQSWLTGKRLVSIPFATLCDPLMSTGTDLKALMPQIIDYRNREHAARIEIRSTFSQHLSAPSGWVDASAYTHHYLRLDRPPEDLKKTFHLSAVQQPIVRACRSGLSVHAAAGEEDLNDFYSLFIKTRKRLGLPPIPRRFFKALWDSFGSSPHLTVLIARHENIPVGAVILFKFNRIVCLEFAVDDVRFRSVKPNHLLYWHAIQLAYAEGYSLFSFGRTDPDNRGLVQFKERWGTQSDVFRAWHYPRTAAGNSRSGASFRSQVLIRHLASKTPDSVFKLLGHICYRHMG